MWSNESVPSTNPRYGSGGLHRAAAGFESRVHLDVVRTDRGGKDQTGPGEAFGPYEVCHADPDGNEVDLVPGEALGESIATADWQAVFSAMVCYRTASPTQQRDLATAAAALADDTGFPLLVDLRPGLVIIDSGKDRSGRRRTWPGARRFVDLASDIRQLHESSGPLRIRDCRASLSSSSTPPTCPQSGRSGSPHSDTATTVDSGSPTSTIHEDVEPGAGVSESSMHRRGDVADNATTSTSSSRCRPTSRRLASPRPSQRVDEIVDESTGCAGGSPTPKATNW